MGEGEEKNHFRVFFKSPEALIADLSMHSHTYISTLAPFSNGKLQFIIHGLSELIFT